MSGIGYKHGQAGTSANEHERGVGGVWMGTGGFEREQGRARTSKNGQEQVRAQTRRERAQEGSAAGMDG